MKAVYQWLKIPYFWLTFLIVSLLTIILFSYHNLSQTNQLVYLSQANLAYEKQIDSAINRYELFSEYLFNKLIDDVVLETMYNATNGDDATKAVQRDYLYQYLLEDYELVIDYNYRQLHFHLPNGDSFLRFHKPTLFGDNLFDIREAIRIVNTELVYVSGFEEGRIYNGYRFVYPLFYNDTHVGSVEISISISTLIDMLYDSEPESAFFFIIKSDIVQSLVFDDYLENYVESPLSKDYLYDRLVYDQFDEVRTLMVGNNINEFYQTISQDVEKKLLEETSFYHVVRDSNRYYTTQFISIRNISDQHVGYLFVTYEDLGYKEIIVQDAVVYGGISLFFLVAYVALFVYIRDKRRILLLSQTDQLTGLFNRLYYNSMTIKEIERSRRYGNHLSMIIMDIDHFKHINDEYGHLTGDEILREISRVLKKNVRKYDTISRWGGEEFALLLPQTECANAVKVAEKIQRLIMDYPFTKSIHVTLSYGVSELDDTTQTIEDLFAKADKNLYIAKNTGRNKIVSD